MTKKEHILCLDKQPKQPVFASTTATFEREVANFKTVTHHTISNEILSAKQHDHVLLTQ